VHIKALLFGQRLVLPYAFAHVGIMRPSMVLPQLRSFKRMN